MLVRLIFIEMHYTKIQSPNYSDWYVQHSKATQNSSVYLTEIIRSRLSAYHQLLNYLLEISVRLIGYSVKVNSTKIHNHFSHVAVYTVSKV